MLSFISYNESSWNHPFLVRTTLCVYVMLIGILLDTIFFINDVFGKFPGTFDSTHLLEFLCNPEVLHVYKLPLKYDHQD